MQAPRWFYILDLKAMRCWFCKSKSANYFIKWEYRKSGDRQKAIWSVKSLILLSFFTLCRIFGIVSLPVGLFAFLTSFLVSEVFALVAVAA